MEQWGKLSKLVGAIAALIAAVGGLYAYLKPSSAVPTTSSRIDTHVSGGFVTNSGNINVAPSYAPPASVISSIKLRLHEYRDGLLKLNANKANETHWLRAEQSMTEGDAAFEAGKFADAQALYANAREEFDSCDGTLSWITSQIQAAMNLAWDKQREFEAGGGIDVVMGTRRLHPEGRRLIAESNEKLKAAATARNAGSFEEAHKLADEAYALASKAVGE